MERINDLYSQLKNNVGEIDSLLKDIAEKEFNNYDFDILERLYEREFVCYMDNISIYEDLYEALEAEPKDASNELTLARIRKDSANMLRVEMIDLSEEP